MCFFSTFCNAPLLLYIQFYLQLYKQYRLLGMSAAPGNRIRKTHFRSVKD